MSAARKAELATSPGLNTCASLLKREVTRAKTNEYAIFEAFSPLKH